MAAEREALKVALQRPGLCGPAFDTLEKVHFTFPRHQNVFAAIAAAGGTQAATSDVAWVGVVSDACADDEARQLLLELAVESLLYVGDDEPRYVYQVISRLREFDLTRQIVSLKAQMQRMNPVETDGHRRVFGELMALEGLKRQLRAAD
jgi:DNA primase